MKKNINKSGKSHKKLNTHKIYFFKISIKKVN